MINNDPFCERDFLNSGNNTMTWYDYTNLFLMTSIIYATGFCVSSWIIGKYMLVPLPEKKETMKKYQDKYSLDDMEKDISSNSEVTKNTSVLEKTPNGIVIMRYNKDREGFEYWCNDKNIKYDYLETVARKFVIMNFCTKLYVDRRKNIKEQHEDLDRKEEKKKEEDRKEGENVTEKKSLKKELVDDCVFVKSRLSVEKKQEEEIIDRKKVVAKKANKYLFMGKVNDFDWLRKPEEKRDEKNEISFSNFKNLFMKR